MEIRELRKAFLDYFSSLGYKELSASSLIPENDPSVLFTTAGMQQFRDFYLRSSEAPAKKVITIQPVFRTSDIDEVGDDTHLTMFEMLGNFVFGESSAMKLKEAAIKEAWQLINTELKVTKDRVHATVFAGDRKTPQDTQSAGVWASLGIPAKEASRAENFWGPTGDEGPCGPNTEIYVDGIEVWNLVFNQYNQDRDGKFTQLEHQGLDTGSGLERLATTLQGKDSVWQIEPFIGWLRLVDPNESREARIAVDHLRAAIFLISNGILPANKGREYVLRRLIRRTVFLSRKLPELDCQALIGKIHSYYAENYQLADPVEILEIITKEKEQFEKNLGRATAHLEKWLETHRDANERQATELAFYLFESYGFPKELVFEYLISQGVKLDAKHFGELFTKHQIISRSGIDKQFKGGLADHNEQTIKHHTAHHLLLAALREVLGPTVFQRGSNVTSERLRLDFSFDRKLTEEELKKVEKTVNEKIKADLKVEKLELPKDEALKLGALAEFGQKYGETVSVYRVGDFSLELCGGPHVEHTGVLSKFEILKEEASSQGIRRIKAKVLD
ncbi:MAG TPA: alanine--tRNA ligase [Candidatus Saccharimonadales bacterium]|nr:alanine--tRNA ligase [Candidatus Saccharimonadales bacterium]